MDDKKSTLTPLPAERGKWVQSNFTQDAVRPKTPVPNMVGPEMPVPSMIRPGPATPVTEVANAMEPIKIAKDCKPYVMVKINKQGWDELYEPELGFERGTIFPALDLPFVGEGACRYE